MTTADNHDHQKDQDKEKDIWHQPLNRANAKEALFAFLGEFGVQLIFYVMLGTTVGVMIWVGIWFVVLLIPLAVTLYYLFKKYQNKNHEKI